MVSTATKHVTFYFTLLISSYGAFAFQPSTSITTATNQYKNHHGLSETTLYQAVDDDSDTSSSATEEEGLSKQDAILQAALGISPESEEELVARRERLETSDDTNNNRNVVVAALSFVAAVANYLYLFANPVTDVQLLYEMSKSSESLENIGRNGRPTVVDFWAPWCENCKRSATTLALVEKEYGDRVNFVLVNGDLAENWEAIERFRVDAIPHLALVTADGDVETALIGAVPSEVLRADLDVLLDDAGGGEGEGGAGAQRRPSEDVREALPYKMFDPFQGKEESTRRVRFERTTTTTTSTPETK